MQLAHFQSLAHDKTTYGHLTGPNWIAMRWFVVAPPTAVGFIVAKKRNIYVWFRKICETSALAIWYLF